MLRLAVLACLWCCCSSAGDGGRLGKSKAGSVCAPQADHVMLQVAAPHSNIKHLQESGPCRQDCGCWERLAGVYSCGSRITWIANLQATETGKEGEEHELAPERAPTEEAFAFAAARVHSEFPETCTCPLLTSNAYHRVEGVGGWGGWCTCPDGQRYDVGDRYDGCARGPASLACEGGTPGACHKEVNWTRFAMKVTCAPPPTYVEPQGGRPELPCSGPGTCCGERAGAACDLTCKVEYSLMCDAFSLGSGSDPGRGGGAASGPMGLLASAGKAPALDSGCPRGWRLRSEQHGVCCRCAHESVTRGLPQPCSKGCPCWTRSVGPGSWTCGKSIELWSNYVWDAAERLRKQFPNICTCSMS